MFPAFYELLLPTILLRGGARERESRERGTRNLLGDFGSPWTEVNGVWVRGGQKLHISDKKLIPHAGSDSQWQRMGRDGARGGEREGGNFPCNVPE